jgi:hypothetical protein
MVLLGTLRAVGFLPATTVFKCNECKFSVSEPVGRTAAMRRVMTDKAP